MRQFIARRLRAIAQTLDPQSVQPASNFVSPGTALINALAEFQRLKTLQNLAIVVTPETCTLFAVAPTWQAKHPAQLQVTSIETLQDLEFLPIGVACATEAIQKLPGVEPAVFLPDPEPGSFWAANMPLLQLINLALSIALKYGTPCPFHRGYRTYRDSYLSISANPQNGAVFVVLFLSGMGGSDRVLDLSEQNVLESYIPHLHPDDYEGTWENRLAQLWTLLTQQQQTCESELEPVLEVTG